MLPLLTAIITLGTPDDYITAIGNWSSPWFISLLPILYVIVGFALGGLIIKILAEVIIGGIERIGINRKKDNFE